MSLGIILLWIVVFLVIFSGGDSHPAPVLSPQAEIAWRWAEIAVAIGGGIVGLIFTVKIIRNN
jgi:hypothetical protein